MGKLEIKARIQNKYNTLEYWENISRGFIPLAGEVCFATHNNNLLYQKIGDGKTDFQDLPWLTNQGDWDEQDENSPSYIKNRIAYKYPQDTQDTILSGTLPYSYIKFSTLPNINLLPDQYQNIDTIAFLDVSNIAISANQLTSQFSLYNLKLNNVTKKNININEIFEINEDAEAYLFGNNQFNDYLIQYLTNGTYYPDQQIVPHINLGSDYGFGTILLVEDNVITRVVASVIAEEANITASGYYPAALIRIKKPGIKPIDPEFLGDLRADQHEINPKSTSYIKNNYGVIHTINGFGEDSLNTGDTIFSGSYTLEPNIEVVGSYQARTNQIDTNYLEELYQALGEFALTTWAYEPQSFDPRVRFSSNIIINGETYKDCTHQILDLSILGGALESNKFKLLMLGNPKLIYKALLGALNVDFSGVGSQEYLYDNGMPFGLILDSSGALYGFASYKNLDNINLMLQLHHINLGFHQIPDAYITRNVQIGEWDGQSNGITFGNGYEASGINSIAMGLGTKAQGDESFAQGYYSIAGGKSSISLGENTEALGENSVALGKRAIANGLNSIAIGANYIQKIENPQWLDNSTFITDGQVSEEFTHIKYGEYWEEIESITYLPESDKSQIKSKTERYRNSYTSTSISYNSIAEGENSIILGIGNKAAKNNSIILGQCNKDIENNQTIIGKFNNPIEGAFVIGNGSDLNSRSNAVEIDWEGNAKFKGSISISDLEIKDSQGIVVIDSLLDIIQKLQAKIELLEKAQQEILVDYQQAINLIGGED